MIHFSYLMWDLMILLALSLRLLLPLVSRKRLAVWIDGQNWIPFNRSMSNRIVRDWAEKDPKAFHSFLWSNHLSYAKNYESVHAFGARLNLCRRMLFQDLTDFLGSDSGLLQSNFEVKSIFEIGCSSGYLLRFFEENLFPNARIIEGVDIDKYAIEKGKKYLQEHGSKVHLVHSDITELDNVMKGRKFDLILCAGVLMYFDEVTASGIVQKMLDHSSGIVVIKEIAHPSVNNAKLLHSKPRMEDGGLIHNVDAMVRKSNGIVLLRRWYGPELFDEQTFYSVFCRPAVYS